MADSYLGAGDLYIDRLTAAGVSTGQLLTGNAAKFEIQANADIKEQTSKGRSTYGQVIASAVLPQPAKIMIDLNQLDKTNLALAFLGEDSVINLTGSTVSDVAYTVPTLDSWLQLAHRTVSAQVVKVGAGASIITGTDTTLTGASNWANVDVGAYDATGDITMTASAVGQYITLPVANATTVSGKKYRLEFAVANLVETWTIMDFAGTQTIGTVSADGAFAVEFTATTTGGLRLVSVAATSSGDFDNFFLYNIYLEDTDYTMDDRQGMLKPLSTGTMVAADSVAISYTYASETGFKVVGMTEPTIRCLLRLDGKNYVDGKTNIVTVYDVKLKPTSAVDFLSDDFTALSLEGTLETPSIYDHPFKVESID